MKNRKIILGLGTITALGAMSMAFVACGLKAGDVDEKIKDFKEKELPHIINVEVFKTQVDKFFSEIGKGSKKEDPKEIQYDFKQTDTVKDLMDVIKELMVEIKRIKYLADEYDLYVPTDELGKELTKLKTYKETEKSGSYKMMVIKANEKNPSTTNLKKEIEFKFKVK